MLTLSATAAAQESLSSPTATVADFAAAASQAERDAALVALAVEEKLVRSPNYLADPVGVLDRLSDRRRADLAARGLDEAVVPQLLARCMGSIDFEGLSPQRLQGALEADAEPALVRAWTVLRAADIFVAASAERDPERLMRDAVLDVIVAQCVADA